MVAAALVATATVIYAQPITIRYACGSLGKHGDRIRRLAESFERSHPGVLIKIEPIVDNYENKLLSMVAANIAPDVAVTNPNRFVAFASRGVLKPLDEYPDIHGPEVDLAGRYPNMVEAFQLDGHQYAIPVDVACSAYIYYNKRAFDEAGLNYPTGDWTWDTHIRPELREKDFVWVMDQLTRRPRGSLRPSQYGFTTSWPQLWMETLLMSSGVRLWDSDAHPTELYLDRPEVIEIFQFAADCSNKYHWIPSNNDVTLGAGSSMQDEFRKGKIAMLQSGAWEVEDMRKKHPGEWDIAPFPTFARSKNRDLPGEGVGVCILKSTRHPKEAWEWLKYLSGVDALTTTAKSGETQPAIRRLAQTPGIWLPAADAAGPNRFPEHLSITDDGALRVRTIKTPTYFEGIRNSIQGNYYNVLTGSQSASVALHNLQESEPSRLRRALARANSGPYPTVPVLICAIVIVLGLVAWVFWPERNRRLGPIAAAENRSGFKFIAPWLCGLALTVGPMLYSFMLSLADSDIVRPPQWRGLDNYLDALNPRVDDTLFVSLRQTFLFTIISVPLGMAFSLALALLLNLKVKGIPLFRALYYLPSLASAVAMSLIWMRLFDRDHGLLNLILYGADGRGGLPFLGRWLSAWAGTPGEPVNWLGNTRTVIPAFVIMGLWGAGGGVVILLAGLQGIPNMFYEAAVLDGAGPRMRFRHVTLPMLSPTLFFTLVTGLIGSLQVFSQAFVITSGGPDRATYFFMVWLYQTAFGELRMGYASALAWILFLIIMAITAIQFVLAKRWVYYEGAAR